METPVTGYLGRATVRMIADVLSSGGIAVLPTDTIYGFHCLASKTESIHSVLGIKGRGARAGLIVLVSDLAMADRLVRGWPGDSRAILSRAWPAPLTAILPALRSVPRSVSPRGTIALRIPAEDGLRRLIRAVGGPVVSTSVNRSGREPMTRIAAIRAAFPGLGAYISRRGRSSILPSTVVDFTAAEPRILREGRYRLGLGA